jgi:hypothetical protein
MALGRSRVRIEIQEDDSYFLVAWRVFGGDDFTYVKASFRQQFPRSSGAEWLPDSKAWVLPIWQRATLRAWCARLFEHDAVTWRAYAEEPHTRQEQRQQSSQRQDTPRTPQTSPMSDAYGTLHLVPDAPLWAAEAVYRAAQKLAHPDAGGDHAQAVALNRAITTIRTGASCSGAQRRSA